MINDLIIIKNCIKYLWHETQKHIFTNILRLKKEPKGQALFAKLLCGPDDQFPLDYVEVILHAQIQRTVHSLLLTQQTVFLPY